MVNTKKFVFEINSHETKFYSDIEIFYFAFDSSKLNKN
jgi:hypothetical protein